MRCIVFGVLSAALAASASGQTITWTGAGDGVTWGQAANWSPAQVPTAVNDVVIPAGAGSIQIGAITATAATVSTARTIALTTGTSVISGGTWTLQSGATGFGRNNHSISSVLTQNTVKLRKYSKLIGIRLLGGPTVKIFARSSLCAQKQKQMKPSTVDVSFLPTTLYQGIV